MNPSGQLAWPALDRDFHAPGAPAESPAVQNFYLHPGNLHVASGPTTVTTILGSCVAVCLWDQAAGIGGINHYLLPVGSRNSSSALRYGNLAIGILLEKLVRAGASVANLQAKLFGGACVLDAMRGRENHLGSKNIEVARVALSQAGIPLVAADVGGDHGRKVIFQTHDGSAKVKLL